MDRSDVRDKQPGAEGETPERADDAEGFDVVYVGLLTGHGGDALQMLALAEGVMRAGARVRIIVPASEHSATFQQRCEAAGVPCERTTLLSVSMYGTRQSIPSLLRLFRSIDAPVVHFHTGNSLLPRSVILTLELLRYRRTFVTLQSPYETIDPSSGRARLWSVISRRRFQVVVSPSEHGTAFQRRCGIPDELTATIPNAIDVAAMRGGEPSVPRSELGVDAETPIVLFTSRLDRQKRPVDAVRAFAMVAEAHPTALLVLAGAGEEERAVREAASDAGLCDQVRLVGYQTNIADWLAAATVWILPTERENFSVAVLEALAAGCAVLSTACPGNDEVLVHEDNALLFPIGDVDSAAHGLRRLLEDETLRHELSTRAHHTAERYAVDRMVHAYLEQYRRLENAPDSLRPARG